MVDAIAWGDELGGGGGKGRRNKGAQRLTFGTLYQNVLIT